MRANESTVLANTTEGSSSYLTKQQVANRFSVTVRTIDVWMALGLIPFFKISRTVRFRENDIDANMDRRCRVTK
jgi:excisionase family DNA binding protein